MKFLYFSAPWCGPCNMLRPIMERVAEKYDVEKISVDDDFELSAKYNVKSIPMVFLIDDNGEVLGKAVGVQREETYYEMIKEANKQ